ncbi:MAG: arginine--tRNA ligase [Fibrobacteria bacterium]|nr:arginine--tRNA ligase [Fibrobacteria bacterium]
MTANIYKEKIAQLLCAHTGVAESDISKVITTPPSGVGGDFSVPCFTFARVMKKSPKIIAESLAGDINLPEDFDEAVAVNGYLNFFVNKKGYTQSVLLPIHQKKEQYGVSATGEGKTIVIDFSSPNMGKELAFHHLRGTMLGNSLSRIYKSCGYRVVRINHLGDWGTSYGKLITMYIKEGLGEDDTSFQSLTIEKLNQLYQAFAHAAEAQPELEDEARETFRTLEAGDERYRKLWQVFRDITLQELKRLYAILGVEFDEYKGEAFFVDQAPSLIKEMQERGLCTTSRGSQVVELDTEDMPPFMLQKSDGSTLYATRDLCAALYRKKTFNFAKNLYIVDMGQALHFRQLVSVLEKMDIEWAQDCEHIAFGLILTKGKDGKWERGKTRAGGVSLLKDVIESASQKILEIINEKNPELVEKENIARQVAVGALVFSSLKTKRRNDVNFEWDKVLSFDGDTGPYVVNAHVRLSSILRKHQETKAVDTLAMLEEADPDFSNLEEEQARELIGALALFPEKVLSVLEKNEPCILSQYAISVAEKAHGFIHSCRVLGSKEELERLYLVNCARIVLKNTLTLLGVPPVERM